MELTFIVGSLQKEDICGLGEKIRNLVSNMLNLRYLLGLHGDIQ